MEIKNISNQAQGIIDQYKNFQVGSAVCSIPYFNNKTRGTRAGLRVEIGKGDIKDIHNEIIQKTLEQKIDTQLFNSETLKKFLVDNNIGTDCSGFVYHILNEESKQRNKGTLDVNLNFSFKKGLFNRIKAKIRPTFADDLNSKIISLSEVEPGDIITIMNGERDHILVVNKVEYENSKPITIYYAHAIAWPTDGEYGHGIHEGKINIASYEQPITEQKWVENDKSDEENYTFARAKKSHTELRRMSFLC